MLQCLQLLILLFTLGLLLTVSLENRGRSTLCQQDRAQQAFLTVMTTYYTVLFNKSPRKHPQASSLSQKTAGGQIKSKEPHFLTTPLVTPTLTDRDRNQSVAGSESIREGTSPEPYIQQSKERSTLLLFLGSVCGY